MKKIFFDFLLLVMLVYGVLALPKTEYRVEAVTNEEFVIRAYGDSISYGETLTDLSKAYPAVFAQKYVDKLDAQFIAKGVSGDKTTDLLEELQPYINKTALDIDIFEETDIITLCIGANNILGPAINNISGFLTGSITEQEYQDILDYGVNTFKQDYPQILQAFDGKKVIVMTIYNPYKYLSLNDISISSSISSYETIIRSNLTKYETKFQNMLSMSMESLQIINNQIRDSESDSVTVVDIWNLFEGFSKNQYLDYINADISQLEINASHISAILQNNLSSLMDKIIETCDPHPTQAGHAVIASKHNETFVTFDLIANKEISNLNRTEIINFEIKPPFQGNYTYKLVKSTGSNMKVILETKNNTFEVQANELEGTGYVYGEIYFNNEKLERTNDISFNLQFEDNIINPDNNDIENSTSSNKKNNFIFYVVGGALLIPIGVMFIYFIIKSRKET